MKNKGITLIGLVITIVVLIILASVAITLSLGENGVLRKASRAKEDTLVAQNEESMQIAETTNKIEEVTSGSRDTVTIDRSEYENLLKDVQTLKSNSNNNMINPKKMFTATLATISEGRSAGTYKASSSSYTKANLEGFDDYFEFTQGTGWKVKKSGTYLFEASQAAGRSATGTCASRLYVNGEIHTICSYYVTTNYSIGNINGQITMYLESGTNIDFALYNESAFTWNGQNITVYATFQ